MLRFIFCCLMASAIVSRCLADNSVAIQAGSGQILRGQCLRLDYVNRFRISVRAGWGNPQNPGARAVLPSDAAHVSYWIVSSEGGADDCTQAAHVGSSCPSVAQESGSVVPPNVLQLSGTYDVPFFGPLAVLICHMGSSAVETVEVHYIVEAASSVWIIWLIACVSGVVVLLTLVGIGCCAVRRRHTHHIARMNRLDEEKERAGDLEMGLISAYRVPAKKALAVVLQAARQKWKNTHRRGHHSLGGGEDLRGLLMEDGLSDASSSTNHPISASAATASDMGSPSATASAELLSSNAAASTASGNMIHEWQFYRSPRRHPSRLCDSHRLPRGTSSAPLRRAYSTIPVADHISPDDDPVAPIDDSHHPLLWHPAAFPIGRNGRDRATCIQNDL